MAAGRRCLQVAAEVGGVALVIETGTFCQPGSGVAYQVVGLPASAEIVISRPPARLLAAPVAEFWKASSAFGVIVADAPVGTNT